MMCIICIAKIFSQSDGIIVKRIVVGTALILIIVELVLVTSFLFFTPIGNSIMSVFAPAPTPAPILTPRGTPPAIDPSAAYLLDADTGHALLDLHGEKRLPMASTTKMMTAILVLDRGNLNQLVTIKDDAVA